MRTFSYIMLLVLMTSAYILLVVGSVMTHEHIHQVIYESYGIPSRVEYNWDTLYDPRKWFDGYNDNITNTDDALGVTYGEKACPTEYCEIQHNLLEFWEYGLQVIVGLFFIAGMITISYIHYRARDKKLDQLEEEYKTQEYTLIDYDGELYLES